MRAVVQRVQRASVEVEGEVIGHIGFGVLVFVGITVDDTPSDRDWLAGRIAKLRIFEDDEGKMNRSLIDAGGEALVISQFTLYGNVAKGTRPSFNRAAPAEVAVPLYESFVAELSKLMGKPVPTGRFGAMMQIDARNHGPVTLVIDTKQRDA